MKFLVTIKSVLRAAVGVLALGLTGTGSGDSQTVTVYGQVPADQFPLPGRGFLYNDTVVATLTGVGINSETANLRISANVLDACLLSATDMAFRTYSGSFINSASTILGSCTNGTSYDVRLNAGTAAASTVISRYMTGPDLSLLHYRLLNNAARTVNWSNTVELDTVDDGHRNSAATSSLDKFRQIKPTCSLGPIQT